MPTESQLTLPMHGLDSSDAKKSDLLAEAEKKLGFVPNMYGNLVNLPALLETYLYGYDKFRMASGLNAVEQEVVLLTISYENSCHYCVAAHSMLAENVSRVPLDVIDAIREGRDIIDPTLAALSRLTSILVKQRCLVERADVDAFLAAGFKEQDVLAILLAISVKTISNYSNHLFDTPVDAIFQSHAWQAE